jgi:arylsulfatase A-like enzyme
VGGAQAAHPGDRNVVLLILDDTGVDLFGAYGEYTGADPPPEHLATPSIQALAERGVLFRNAWSAPLCAATRATILTGQYGFRNGIGGHGALVPPADAPAPYVPLAQQLATGPRPRPVRAMIGKWNVSDFTHACSPPAASLVDSFYTPVEAGFTRYQGSPDVYVVSQFDWCDVVEGAAPFPPCDSPVEVASPPYCFHRPGYETTVYVDQAVAFLSEAPPQPWFLQIAFHSVHAPREAPPENLHTQPDILARYEPGESVYGISSDHRPMQAAMLEAMDTEIGRFLAALESYDPGLSRTTVILVGDNGSVLPLPTSLARDRKGSIYEGGVNVPLIVAGDVVHPARIGTETPALVHTADLFPTILELTGQPPPAGIVIDGVSFVGLLRSATASPPRSCAYADGDFAQGGGREARSAHTTAVRNATHKLIRFPNRPEGTVYELYGLGPHGQLDESVPLAPPTDPLDPGYDSYQSLLAELDGDAESPCQPITAAAAPPLGCGVGPELAPALGLLLAARRARSRAGLSARPDPTAAAGARERSRARGRRRCRRLPRSRA